MDNYLIVILLIILFVDRVLVQQARVHGDVRLEAQPLLDAPLEGAPPGGEGPPPGHAPPPHWPPSAGAAASRHRPVQLKVSTKYREKPIFGEGPFVV